MSIFIYLYILSQHHKEDIRTGARRHRAKKKERIKSKIGKIKKVKVMLQKRLETVKKKQKTIMAYGMRCETVLTADLKSLGLRGQEYDGEVDSTEQWPTKRMNICSNWL